MGDKQRWSVTYTGQITKKHAVYQDGFLELQPSRRKVMLYDEYDKLLGSRFVKNEEVIESGKTLAFDSYRVDIADECGGRKPLFTFNGQEEDKKVGVKLGKKRGSFNNPLTSGTTSAYRKPTFVSNKAQDINLSPSRRVIRDFSRSETDKYNSSSSSMEMSKAVTTVWQALYTTQLTQKAQKFHDGFLHLVVRNGSLGRQVMLYDEYDKVLGSRFLKKEEVIGSGARVTFDSFLVDIGDEYGGNKPVSTLNCLEKDQKAAGISGSTYSHKSKDNITSVDFKRSQINKYGSSPSCPDQKNPITLEWHVMYTTQVTQKAKRFHDGFLRLVAYGGSQGRQVALLAEDGLSLGRRFLKSYENVKTGSTIELPNYLVEVGQSRDDASTTKKDLEVKASDVSDMKLTRRVFTTMPLCNGQSRDNASTTKKDSEVKASDVCDIKLTRRVLTTMPLCNGKTQSKTSPKKVTILDGLNSNEEDAKLPFKANSNEPRRAASDILSILRKPMVQANVLPMNKPLMEDSIETQSSVVNSDTVNYGRKITEDESEEGTFFHDSSTKVIKSKATELIDDEKCEVSGNREEIQAGSSTFFYRSEEIASMRWDTNVELPNHIELFQSSPVLEEYKFVTPAGDEELNRSNKKIKLEDASQVTCSVGAVTSDCTSHDAGDKTLENAFYMTEMDDLPSFDLGF